MSDQRKPKTWESYEQVATYLLNYLADQLGLDRVERKQKISGASGTEWEVDAKGVAEGAESFVLVECRATKARQPQSKVASFAWSIQDTGASGGILVTPVQLQAGAKKVADASGIIHAQLDLGSTPSDFAVKFLNKLVIGASVTAVASAGAECLIRRKCRSCGEYFDCAANEQTCVACSGT
jgi:hypothetical protein